MGLIDRIKNQLGIVSGNDEDVQEADDKQQYGGEDAAIASQIKGRDLNSILSLLNETNSGEGDDISGSDEYKAAYMAVVKANGYVTWLADSITRDTYNFQERDYFVNELKECQVAINNYTAAKSKGVFFKHPITTKGKKRLACMQNASNIIEAAIEHFDGIYTGNDNEEFDKSYIRNATIHLYNPSEDTTNTQMAKLGEGKGLGSKQVEEDIHSMARYISEVLFSPDILHQLLQEYKTNALEVSVKALLIKKNTPDANKTLVSAFNLGGPNLGDQLKTSYEFLKKLDLFADELWKVVGSEESPASQPDKALLLEYKKDLLKLIRTLNLYRKINTKQFNRF